MNNYIWIILVILIFLGACVAGLWIVSLNRRLEYYRNTLSSLMTNGNLVWESMEFVATAYGLSVDELVAIIENYQNTTGERK